MKHEIIFKGKSVDNNEWVYGDLIHRVGIPPSVAPIQIGKSGVITETVSQFTGLCDKNGKGIFEHDIILIYESESSYQFTVEVIFHKGMFCYRNKACGFTPLWYVSDRCEVIGNVFDNPDLLKENSHG